MNTALKVVSPESLVPSNEWPGLGQREAISNKEVDMLEAILIVLVILWALGFFAFHVGGGLIHALLVIALVILIIRLLQGKKIV
jgi:hypothetical protein